MAIRNTQIFKCIFRVKYSVKIGINDGGNTWESHIFEQVESLQGILLSKGDFHGA